LPTSVRHRSVGIRNHGAPVCYPTMRRWIPLLLLISCYQQSRLVVSDSYSAEIDKWRTDRRARLLSDNGWLTLVGLDWLHDGTNDVTLPAHPSVTVRLILNNAKVTLQPNPSVAIAGPTVLRDDTDAQGPTVIRIGTLNFQIIKRADKSGDRFGVRVKDTESESRKNFKGLDYFPTNPACRIEARFEPYQPPKKIAITNVLGMTSDETSPGALVFTLQGRDFRIDPILEQGEKDLFIIFKDATSGKETYAAARYLYAHPPDATGKTMVDFNKSYNPPCVFTPYATCPLPPAQNRLPIRVEAGEKKYAGHA
jgi:uncharacterized protein (DUF1684 family)